MAELLLMRTGAGKTERAQAALLALKQSHPLGKAWMLFSTERQILDFRRRLTTQPTVLFNIEFFNFYTLYRRILATARTPGRWLRQDARAALIRNLLQAEFSGDGYVFGAVAHTPGFALAVARLIDELKQQRIPPDLFLEHAQSDRERELAQIYKAYQNLLITHDLIDREGEGWLAVEALQAKALPLHAADRVQLMIVDGYDQFNPLQATLLSLLDLEVETMQITLTTVPEREQTIGRRFEGARLRLQKAFAERLQEVRIDAIDIVDRPPAVQYLLDTLLLPGVNSVIANADAVHAAGQVAWLEAPSPAAETAAVLRRIKRLLIDGTTPDGILIAVRDWAGYGAHLATHAARYQVPLALHYGDMLHLNPVIATLLDMLKLHPNEFQRRAVLDALRAPYMAVPGLDAQAIDLLDRITSVARFAAGRASWQEAIQRATRPIPPDEEQGYEGRAALLSEAQAEAIRTALDAFFDAVTPPETGATHTYVAWVEALIGADDGDPDEGESPLSEGYSLAMPACIRRQQDDAVSQDELITRDLHALKRLKGLLRDLLTGVALADKIGLGQGKKMERATFLRDLLGMITSATVEHGGGRDGRVLATTAANARSLPHDHVFIIGLAEGVFPAPVSPDPLLLDSERGRLAEVGIALAESAERAADDGLFYGLIGLAGRSLTLSRPTIKNGELWSASHLWKASGVPFADFATQTTTIGMDGVPAPAEAAVQDEVALAIADQVRRGVPPDPAIGAWLSTRAADYWQPIVTKAAIEYRRRAHTSPHDQYSGRLQSPAGIAGIAEFINTRVWSPSALGEYGRCPYGYFAKRLLRIEPLEPLDEGMDVRQQGTLYHEILEATYRQITHEGMTISPDQAERALAILETHLDRLLPTAPERLSFRASAVWAGEQVTLRRRAHTLVTADFSPKNPASKVSSALRTPYLQEVSFGDPTPLSIDIGAGIRLPMRGVIDRVDRTADSVILIDYKSGSTPIDSKEIMRGRNFQMLIYLLAAPHLAFGKDGTARTGVFWHISNNKGSGALNPAADAEVIVAGTAHLRAHHEKMKAGDFRVQVNKVEEGKCASYCEFHQLCRSAVIARGKP